MDRRPLPIVRPVYKATFDRIRVDVVNHVDQLFVILNVPVETAAGLPVSESIVRSFDLPEDGRIERSPSVEDALGVGDLEGCQESSDVGWPVVWRNDHEVDMLRHDDPGDQLDPGLIHLLIHRRDKRITDLVIGKQREPVAAGKRQETGMIRVFVAFEFFSMHWGHDAFYAPCHYNSASGL